MTTKQSKIPATDDAWDTGALGRDAEFVSVAQDDIESVIDEALELQMVSIRLQKSLIDDFKCIAKLNGLGYQPLMRQVLTRFADCEMKRICRHVGAEMEKAQESKEQNEKDSEAPQKKIA